MVTTKSSTENLPKRIGDYELGKTLGSGNFAKVKYARQIHTAKPFAIKIIDKKQILKYGLSDNLKREIGIMKSLKHPNILELHEVLSNETKIFLVLEYASGGELFDKIFKQGKLTEAEARKYFHQLIDAVDYCHRRGVYHRDLKPENLLLDSEGNLKLSDFGLSTVSQQFSGDGLLHTTCGTPNYSAPEVICVRKGYDGAKADLWSCGVILYVLLVQRLPFNSYNMNTLRNQIYKADFTCPSGLSPAAVRLIKRILTPNPYHRADINQIMQSSWFRKGYQNVCDAKPTLDIIKIEDFEAVDDLLSCGCKKSFSKGTFVNALDLMVSILDYPLKLKCFKLLLNVLW